MKQWWKANQDRVNIGLASGMCIVGIVWCVLGLWFGLVPAIGGVVLILKTVITRKGDHATKD